MNGGGQTANVTIISYKPLSDLNFARCLLHALFSIGVYKPLMASRDFVILSVDGTRVVEDRLEEHRPATSLSILDHYKNPATNQEFENITLLNFAKSYTMHATYRGK